MTPHAKKLTESNVLTENGVVRIEDLRVGDKVIGFQDGKRVENTIEDIEKIKTTRSRILINGKVLLSPEQSIVANGNVTHVKLLKIGDWLVTQSGRRQKVKTLEKIAGVSYWYRMTIDGNHTYVINGIVMHNASRFWVLGTGTWNAASILNWSATSGGAPGASVPGSGDAVTFDASSGGGTCTVAYDFTVTSIVMGAFTGTLDFSANNNHPTLSTFSCSGTGVRTLNMGSNTWTVTGNNGTVWNIQTTTNLTLTGTGTVDFTYSGSTGTRNILNGSGGDFPGNVKISAGSDIHSDAGGGSGVKGNWDFTGFTGTGLTPSRIGGNLTLATGMLITSSSNTTTFNGTSGTQTITSNGVQCNRTFTIAATAGVNVVLADALNIDGASNRTLTFTSGNFNMNNQNVTCGTFSCSNSNVRTLTGGSGTITLKGNAATIWTTSTDTNLTIVGTITVVCSYAGATGTRTAVCGNTESKAISFSVTAGTDSFATNTAVHSLYFTGFTGTWTNTALSMYGNLTLQSGMTITAGTNALTMAATSGTQTITSNGVAMDRPLTVNGVGSTTSAADALTIGSTRTLTVTNGTLTNGGGALVISAGLYNVGASGVLTLGTATHIISGVGSVWTIAGTVNGLATCVLKFTDTSSSALTFDGAGTTYSLYFSRGAGTGTHTITGSNTFALLKDDGTGTHSLLFVAGTTSTLSTASAWQVSGTSGHLISIGSTTSAFHSIVCSTGAISADYLSLSYSHASGGANFYAGANAVDGGNNSGWNFSARGNPTNSAFFALAKK